MNPENKLEIRDGINIALVQTKKCQKQIRNMIDESETKDSTKLQSLLHNLNCANSSLENAFKLFSDFL